MIKYYRASTNNDTSNNGGSISVNYLQISNGAIDNVFPSVTEDDRSAEDLVRMRKIFGHYYLQNPDKLRNTIAFVKMQPNNDDIIYIGDGTTTDTQADIIAAGGGSLSGGYSWHGSGVLASSLSGGSSEQIFVNTREEGGFHDDDIIFIGELGEFGYLSPYFEIVTATSAAYNSTSGGYILSGLVNAVSGGTVRKSFTDPDNTMVASCVDIGTLESDAYDLVNPVGWGLAQYPEVNNTGTIDAEWEIEVLNESGDIKISQTGGSVLGVVEYANFGDDITVDNPHVGHPYFEIPSSSWYNTEAALEGHTITFKTKGTIYPVWLRQFVKKDSVAFHGVTFVVTTVGE